jgi:hypothetical protein
MDWTQWLLVALFTLGPITTASNVGKPRKPLTAADATASFILNIGLMLAVIFWG